MNWLFKGGNMRNNRINQLLTVMSMILTMALLSPVHAADPEFGITAGFRSNNADTDSSGYKVTGKTGLNFGALALIPIKDAIGFRTAFTYSQRGLDLDSSGNKVEVKLAYLDIPLTLYYKFSDFAGLFAGPVISLVQSKECSQTGSSTCSLTSVQSSIVPISFGVTFKFAPQMGGELVYEQYSGKLSDEVNNLRSVGANFVFYFE